MDQVTQQNAALVEEAAAAASSLQEQASGLSQVVGVFRLENEQMASAPRPEHVVSRRLVRSLSKQTIFTEPAQEPA